MEARLHEMTAISRTPPGHLCGLLLSELAFAQSAEKEPAAILELGERRAAA